MGKAKRAVAAKGLTRIDAYFVRKLKRGRPKKQQPQATKPKCKETSQGPLPPHPPASTKAGGKEKKRGIVCGTG